MKRQLPMKGIVTEPNKIFSAWLLWLKVRLQPEKPVDIFVLRVIDSTGLTLDLSVEYRG